VSGSVTHLGTADEIDAVHDIFIDVLDADLGRETIVGRHQSVLVLLDASEQVRSKDTAGSLQQSTLAMKVEQNWYIYRILWQDDRQRDLEITHFLVDNVLGAHLGACGGGVCWYLCGLWCRGGCEITRNKQSCGSEGYQAR
jgi:hypothetical protein